MAIEGTIATGAADAPSEQVTDVPMPINSQPAGYTIEGMPVAGSTSIGSGSTQPGQISPRF